LIKTNIDDYQDAKNNPRVSSANNSIGMRTTYYTDNNTSTKFYVPQNNSVSEEEKFDPMKNLYFNIVDKTVTSAKQKESNEKRHLEEVKEFLNEWGLAKTSYKEHIEKKHDYKEIINFYDEQTINRETINNENFRKSEIIEDLNTSGIFPTGDENVKFKKVYSDCARNIDGYDKVLTNPHEITVYIKAKDDYINNKEMRINNEIRKKEKIPSDMLGYVLFDKSFETRKIYGKLCDLKEIDNAKESNPDYEPLSAYDNCNIKLLTKQKIFEENRPMTGYDYVKHNIGKTGYLQLRQTFSAFNSNNVYRLHETLNKSNHNVNMNQVRNAFLPPVENKNYSKYFLPLPGYGLNNKINESKPNKNNKKNNKKINKKNKKNKLEK